MTSSSELSLTWRNALVEWLPRVLANFTLEFLRVDHVVRVVPCEELSSPDLASVRRWLIVKIVPIEVMAFWFESFGRQRFDENFLPFGKKCLTTYLEAWSAGRLPNESCFTPLRSALVPQLDDLCREDIWRGLEPLLNKFSGPIYSFDDLHVGNWPKAQAFVKHLCAKDRAITFDGETGECFSCDRDSLTDIDSFFTTDVLCATEQAWKRHQGSFHLRDNVLAIVDVVAQDSQTRVAFDYPFSEHPQH